MNEQRSYIIKIDGIVQGVGMRPFIYKEAKALKLTGFVRNKGSSVMITVSGEKCIIHKFIFELQHNPPINARIDHWEIIPCSTENFDDFRILNSSQEQVHYGGILPDIAVCDECINDILNVHNRRHNYVFTNCTNCGPRYSIIKELPYDRIHTSMDSFSMCPQCESEYTNADNRRFHAQPNCCPNCGPQYHLLDNCGSFVKCENPIQRTKQLLLEGNILAIKGIGGYHLVCNAQDKNLIMKLRNRKKRPQKPFAIMAAKIEDVENICNLSNLEKETITNNKRPIVLLNKKNYVLLPEVIAPGINRYGVMLPYSPLHYFLFDEPMKYLVMTSANVSGMPICYKDKEVLKKLNAVADYFLIHDREIMTPIDDAVVKILDDNVLICRGSRGYAPTSLPLSSPCDFVSLGGNQKATVCIVHKGMAHISQYLGELDNLDTCNEYVQVINRLYQLLRINSQVIVHDLHPNYFSTQYAKKLEKPTIFVQHHHGHMAGCMAEHDLYEDVIGIIFDGTGMGIDGNLWGGEFFVGNRTHCQRVGHLENVTLQGAESVIMEPWKCAVSYLYTWYEDLDWLFPEIEPVRLEVVKKALHSQLNCCEASSMGRFFDCVAALVLGRTHISYEAQAAMELEGIADTNTMEYYNYTIDESQKDESLIIGYRKILLGVLEDIKGCQSSSIISAKFHNTIAQVTIETAVVLREKYKLNRVVLGGGVFENMYLLKSVNIGLKKHGFQVFYNIKLPLNDGGLSFGQASVAAAMLEEGVYVSGNTNKDYFH